MSRKPPKRHHIDRRADELVGNADKGAPNRDPNHLYTTAELAVWLALSPQFLEIGRAKKWGPRYIKVGPRAVRYRHEDVVACARPFERRGRDFAC